MTAYDGSDRGSITREARGRAMLAAARRLVVAGLAAAAALVAFGEGSASAATPITWADFSATQQVCADVCTRTKTVVFENCDEYGCWLDSEQVCVETQTQCHQERKPLPDGDLIDVRIEHGVVDGSAIDFRLLAGSGITWWKQIAASGGPDIWKVWTQDGGSWCNWPEVATPNCSTNSEWAGVLTSGAGQIVFSKAKMFGAQTDVYVLRDLASQLRGGDRVTFTWVKD